MLLSTPRTKRTLATRQRSERGCRRASCWQLIAVDYEIRLASIEMLPTTSLRLAINGASTSWRSIAAAAKQSASAFAKVNAGDAIEKNTGEMAHSRLVV